MKKSKIWYAILASTIPVAKNDLEYWHIPIKKFYSKSEAKKWAWKNRNSAIIGL